MVRRTRRSWQQRAAARPRRTPLAQQAQVILSAHTEVDLAALKRTFILKWHDALAAAAGPALLHCLCVEAPGVRLRFLAEASTDAQDPRRGEIDPEAVSSQPSSPRSATRWWATTGSSSPCAPPLPCAADRSPLRTARPPNRSPSPAGDGCEPVGDALEAQGVSRQVVAAAPTNATAMQFVRHHDLVAAVPEPINRPLMANSGLRTRPLPLTMPAIPIYLAWHQRNDNARHA
ncbi:LysR substrate-binding domain-containing protein [Streptomyces sp. NPDC058335]|uniref:LysR substrate-binding domain-containing protein n=1 Tax=Streptomyces sp. NPDC058335 TaxID=3346451 RepID=UPI003656AEA3